MADMNSVSLTPQNESCYTRVLLYGKPTTVSLTPQNESCYTIV